MGPATCVAAMWQNVAEIFSKLSALLASDSEMETGRTIVGNSASDGVIEVPTEVLTILASDSETEKDQDMVEPDMVRSTSRLLDIVADDSDEETDQAVIKNGAVVKNGEN